MKQIPFGKPIIEAEERQAVQDVLNGPILVHGPRAKDFEERFADFTDASYAVSVSSCTAGMHLYYFHLGLGPGDEVICPAQTHTATAHAIEFVGAKPVFVDAEINTGNIDIDQLEAAITPNTKAIVVVHFLGVPVDMPRVNALADKHGLRVIEDCALAVGSKIDGVHAGLFGDCGCFSFYPVKHMTTAEGGMLITRDAELAEAVTRKKAFGVDRHVGERKMPGIYEVTMLGFNYRMSELHAAVGIEQIQKMPKFLEAREANYQALENGLKDIAEIDLLESGGEGFISSRYCLSIILKPEIADKRPEIVNSLKAMGVGTSVYYPKPVPHMSYYKDKYGYDETSFPTAARISNASIALPVGQHLDTEDMDYIVKCFKQAVTEVQ